MTSSERRIFAAVVEALVDAPADADVASGIEPLIQRLPRSDIIQLRLLLHGIEQGARLRLGRPCRFSALGVRERQAYLAPWAESRLALKRQAFAALKTLAMLAFYGREDAWAEVGYRGPWLGRVKVPVLAVPELRAGHRPRRREQGPRAADGRILGGGPPGRARIGSVPDGTPAPRASAPHKPAPRTATPRSAHRGLPPGITFGREIDRDMHLRAEVCVIGTGAGGATALTRLVEHGVDAIAVEAGGHPTAEDFDQRELSMLPFLYHNAGLRATANKAIGILQGRGVGGSTLHNTGLVVPPPEGIADRWRYENGLDWGRDTLDAYVADAVRTLGTKPIPEDRINANNDVLRRGARALGWGFSIADHNRVECCGCGYCMLGCAYNRKNGAALTYIPRAVESGAGILADAPAERIERAGGGWRVACALLDGQGNSTGRRAEIVANTIVLAAGALNTPALLRRNGIGNGSVGRGLRLHPSAVVGAVFEEPIRAWRGLPQSVVLDEFASFYDDGRGGYLVIPTAAWPGLAAALTPGMGQSHRRRMRALPHLASAAVVLHDETAGAVTAKRSGRPIARYWPDHADLKTLREGVGQLARLYIAAGAKRVILPYANAPAVDSERTLKRALAAVDPRPHLLALNSVHPQGSCPLDAKRGRGVVDPNGRVWGESDVYLCDTSIFPSSVGVPPQITTMALATGVADAIAAG